MTVLRVLLPCWGLVAAAALAEPPAEPVAAPAPAPPGLSLPAALDANGAAFAMETALTWTLQYNPDLIRLRQDLCVSAEAVNVARQFPTSLNPTVSVEVAPWVFERQPAGDVALLQTLVVASWQQPIELGHRGRERMVIAQATYSQTRWNILQAELEALVETYRAFQTAVYRREKLLAMRRVNQSQAHLLEVLHHHREAAQVPASDVVLAEVESVAVQQELEAARQELGAAIALLTRKIGMADGALNIDPTGPLVLPGPPPADQPEELVRQAQECRPEVRAAWAQVCSAQAALRLAQAERIPVPAIGPHYEHNETGASFYGLGLSSAVPVLNSGRTLVRQREAELCRDQVALEQTRQRIRVEVLTALNRWQNLQRAAAQRQTWAAAAQRQAAQMQDLYDAGQSDLLKLLGVQRRLAEIEAAGLDLTWQATQAYADLLAAQGATSLLTPSLVPDAATR